MFSFLNKKAILFLQKKKPRYSEEVKNKFSSKFAICWYIRLTKNAPHTHNNNNNNVAKKL